MNEKENLLLKVANEEVREELYETGHCFNHLNSYFNVGVAVEQDEEKQRVLQMMFNQQQFSKELRVEALLKVTSDVDLLLSERLLIDASLIEMTSAAKFFSIKADLYQIMDYLVRVGRMWSPYFQWGHLPNCAICQEEGVATPAPYMAQRISYPLCPMHKSLAGLRLEPEVLFEKSKTRAIKVPNENGVIR